MVLHHKFRRGIPGVESDTYHMGYLEDSTLHHISSPSFPQYFPLLQSLYIFGALAFLWMILSCVVFGLREYQYSLRRRRNSLESGDSIWSSNSTVAENTNFAYTRNEIEHHQNPAYPTDPKKESQSSEHEQYPGSINNLCQESSKTMKYRFLEVVKDSSTDTNTSSTDEIDSSKNKIENNLESLMRMLQPETNGMYIPLKNEEESSKQMEIEDVIKLAFPIENTQFSSARLAEKTITEIFLSLSNDSKIQKTSNNDSCTRIISVMRFIAFTANSRKMDNPNIFLNSLTRIMDIFIDSGLIFDALFDSNQNISMLLFEVILQYCFSHWTFGEYENDEILQQFSKWEIERPKAQDHSVLYRYLINIELGLHSTDIMKKTASNSISSKIFILIHHFIENSDRGADDFIGLIPILYQAVEFSTNFDSTLYFYETLYKLVKRHKSSMRLYFTEENSNLKQLIQFGLGIKNDPKLRKLAVKTYKLILKESSQIESWWREVDGGQKSYSFTSIRSQVNAPNELVRRERRAHTPGSWTTNQDSA